jgi:hypothetical protein
MLLQRGCCSQMSQLLLQLLSIAAAAAALASWLSLSYTAAA